MEKSSRDQILMAAIGKTITDIDCSYRQSLVIYLEDGSSIVLRADAGDNYGMHCLNVEVLDKGNKNAER